MRSDFFFHYHLLVVSLCCDAVMRVSLFCVGVSLRFVSCGASLPPPTKVARTEGSMAEPNLVSLDFIDGEVLDFSLFVAMCGALFPPSRMVPFFHFILWEAVVLLFLLCGVVICVYFPSRLLKVNVFPNTSTSTNVSYVE